MCSLSSLSVINMEALSVALSSTSLSYLWTTRNLRYGRVMSCMLVYDR